MTKGIIFYTDNRIKNPIKARVESTILSAELPVVSVSLKPLDFGHNIVIHGMERGYITYLTQINAALISSSSDYVFFCEQDVLYPKSHFDFQPARNDIFYYNSNVWKWEFGHKKVVTYDRMLPLSCLCVNREFALEHYGARLELAQKRADELTSREPDLARKWGYEPGTKKKKRGGFSDDDFETWESEFPVIDIRHVGTFSPPKCTLGSFKYPPKNWREMAIAKLPGWDLKGMFNL